MVKKPEIPLRVPEFTKYRIGVLAGSLAMTQSAIVEMLVDKAFHDARVELDSLTQTFLNKGNNEQILEARAAILAKLQAPSPQKKDTSQEI